VKNKTPMNVNINSRCKVVLTEFGAKTYNEFHSQFKNYRPKELNVDDVLEDSLWSLMRVFGPSIHLGMIEVPFKNNEIEIMEGF
jgi:hypothetical protein